MVLHNKIDSKVLKERLQQETFKRRTVSFYRYFILKDVQRFRDELYVALDAINAFGRIYVAREGVNAQMSVPEHNWSKFEEVLEQFPILNNIPLKIAVEDDGKSFYKLTIKVRKKIVADGLDDDAFDVTNVGKHLSALEWHELVDKEDTIVIDMRNHYESEVGHFISAVCPDVDTFREEVTMVEEQFADKKDEKILLYCTGGVRCEKASAYLKDKGFKDVNQLYGGIIEYTQQIKKEGLEPKFIGKNFVFDERLGERITDDVIAKCHQCGSACDTHTNCANDDCHLLFIQCKSCAEKYDGCCSSECKTVYHAPQEEKLVFRQKLRDKYAGTHIYKSRLRPKLNEMSK